MNENDQAQNIVIFSKNLDGTIQKKCFWQIQADPMPWICIKL
jgi:hypothetical protein